MGGGTVTISNSKRAAEQREEDTFVIDNIRELLGIPHPRSHSFVESLPFSLNDTTAGSETELQVAVCGRKDHVDLPSTIASSNYYANIVRRAMTGDTTRHTVTELEKYLNSNSEEVWENSWFKFPIKNLNRFAREILESDLLSNRRDPNSHPRSDVAKFIISEKGNQFLRVPISYLIKISLADVLGGQSDLPDVVRATGTRIMRHLLSDNTSPETVSFHVVPLRPDIGLGKALAKETAKRFLLTQLLVMYANVTFTTPDSPQKAIIYFSPHPPVRQKQLNECISDAFYRELFMSPCLSGWDDGEAKHQYMCLCHQVLSRSQLNALSKLRDAGIITRNLVVLPNMSNISLANNGVHVSLGSIKLTKHLAENTSGYGAVHEKHLGDLIIKIVEHFLPLFVDTYSAAPYRLDFTDFHPERVLGFLPHELDYTHLRMIWRRWKKKAGLKIFGQPLTPFGLKPLDRVISFLFRLRGDFVPDFRLIDYLVALMSTPKSPALNGRVGSEAHLKKDLSELGVFDVKMSIYLLYRLREFAKNGFSGFEGRYYSLFDSLEQDLSEAVSLQTLITALAFKYVLQGTFTHGHIPDDPLIESERRQIFFGAAIGVPTFFVRADTGNVFLKRIIERTWGVRYSRRYRGYLRVYNRQYRLALANLIQSDATDLIELLGLKDTVDNLVRRLQEPRRYSAAGKITEGIIGKLGVASPLSADATEFNIAAERYYRSTLRKRHIEESLSFLAEDFKTMDSDAGSLDFAVKKAARYLLQDRSACEFLAAVRNDVTDETLPRNAIVRLINLILIVIHNDKIKSETTLVTTQRDDTDPAPIRRAGNW
ncbi:MAG TPA: hypothetical protein VMC85_16960 [Desulfomonilaceae bacterium]|nr:hypothetical protein [Desulfomonilaceae bacterium]